MFDITKPVDLTLHGEGTGPTRARRPVYTDFMPPCNSACPSGENIQAWMGFAQSGDFFEAFQKIAEDNPFPAVMGRVCVRPCETGCNRTHIDTAVSIHAVERYIGDKALEEKWPIRLAGTASGKRVMVIGAGPGGLSAAYQLVRMGHTVEVFEAGETAGGLLATGVPDYRLPKEILRAEIQRLLETGIKIHLGHKVTDVAMEKTVGKFDAVYLSIGAGIIKDEKVPGDGSVRITDAFSFFRMMKADPSPFEGKKVAVLGGGKLALYLSRMLKRLGSEAEVYFEGDKKMMPAYDYETEDALAEGVAIHLLRGIVKAAEGKIVLEAMKTEKGKAIGTGQLETVDADVLILANRQQSDSAFLQTLPGIHLNEDGTVPVNMERMTGFQGVFAGGDMLPAENRSATIAIGHGKKAARFIDGYLKDRPYVKGEKHPTAGYKRLHMWYKTDAPQKEQERLEPLIAIRSFDEVIAGLSEPEAVFEAERCLSCGNCFECDGCFAACPEGAIIKLGKGNRYKFNYDACTGCAVCYEQCPSHAIEMIPEPVNSTI